MTRRLILICAFAITLLATFAGVGWLVLTPAGLQASVSLAARISGERLLLEHVSGRLYDQLGIGHLRWQDETTTIDISGLSMRWSPAALLRGEISIQALGLNDITVESHSSSDEPSSLPDTLALPVSLKIAALEVRQVRVNGTLLADSISGAFSSRAGEHALETLALRRGPLQLHAHGKVATASPFKLSLDATLDGEVADKVFALDLSAAGTLERSEISARRSKGPFDLNVAATVLPFTPQLLEALQLTAKDLDVAAWAPELPHTQIDANCQMGKAQATRCGLENKLSGTLDIERLPIKAVSATLSHTPDTLMFSDLNVQIGTGRLSGKGKLNADGLNADLLIKDLDIAAIHSQMRHTKLAGTATLRGDMNGQRLNLDARGEKLSIQMRLLQRLSSVDLEQLTLQAQAASLKAQGKIQLDTNDFSLTGALENFNPAQFFHTAAGSINSNFKASGRLSDAPRANISFALSRSSYANTAVAGKGQLDMDWPHVRKADIALDLGQNRARLLGAFGKAGESLRLDIDAPALSPYGLEGDMSAHMQLSGTLNAPLLNGQVRSSYLRLPSVGRLRQLSLDARMGAASDAPMNLRLTLDKLDLNEQPNLLRQFDLDLQGTRRQHQLRLNARVSEEHPLSIAMQGGFKTTSDWQGTLTRLSLGENESQYFVRLKNEVPLAFASSHWSIGPAQLKTRNADVNLNASALQGKALLNLLASNPSIGNVKLEISATPPNAWALSPQMPWQGRLHVAIADLSWSNPILGPVWQAGGKLSADVQWNGTPQFPIFNGQINASDLELRQLDTNMSLRNGRLRANIRNSILNLDELTIESVLTQPPLALRRLLSDRGQELIAKPGSLSAQGRMKLAALGQSTDASEQLHLDVTLDRLGVSQTPKQWLLLSGQASLTGQQAKLGINAKLNVDAARWELADLSRPQLSSDVIVHREGVSEDAVKKALPWTGLIQVSMGRYFSFSGAGAKGRLAGQVQIAANAQDLPRATGSVTLVDGSYDAYGQQLTIERGILNFQGLLENPALNILALRKGLPVEAGVEITGYAQAPKVRLVSEPSVPDTEKLSWLVLGRPPEQEGGDAGILLTAVTAIFGNDTGRVGDKVKSTFGIDEINVRSGTLGQQQAIGSHIVSMQGSSQSTGQVLTLGKQLSNRLRLSYEQALGSTGTLVKMTLKMTERFSVVGTSGSDAALDAYYSFAFGKAPTAAKTRKPD